MGKALMPTPKYTLGQNVFTLWGRCIHEMCITGITFLKENRAQEDSAIKIYYTFGFDEFSYKLSELEENVFLTKQDLINSL